MNAQTYTQVTNPVLAVFATSKYHHRRNKQEFKERKQNNSTFDSLFTATYETADEMLLFNDAGCYGKDARPIVGRISSFNQTL